MAGNPASPVSQTPLHVAVVTETYPPEVNGVALTLAHLVGGLRSCGHTVQLIRPRQFRREEPAHGPGFSEILTPGIPIPGYPGLRFGLPVHRTLRRLWSPNPPDIVHIATEGPLGAAAARAARALGLPVSSGFHTNFDTYSRHYRLGWLRGMVTRHLRRFHNRTDLTLVPTSDLARELTRDGYRNVEVLARGVDTQLFNPGMRSRQLRRNWGATDDTLVVAYVGRLAPEKNLSLVTEAFAAIAAANHDTKLLIVGDGPSLSALKRRHPPHIYAGLRRGQDLAAHYASADLFLFPSLTETFGNVVPEALASGLGVVAFDCAAAADLIMDKLNGRSVRAGDRQAFVDAAVGLANNRNELTGLRRHAVESVEHMNWTRIHERFAQKLTELLHRHHKENRDANRLVLAPD
jgi:glycosyltransferase involved in cell wall biosynthesis